MLLSVELIRRPTRSAIASRARRTAAFIWRSFGLRKPKRNALCALYAFMRLVDNVSDEPGRSGIETARLGALAGDARRGRRVEHERSSRFFPLWRTRFRASRFPRATFTT